MKITLNIAYFSYSVTKFQHHALKGIHVVPTAELYIIAL
jgi:hypothetical protein